MLVNVGLYHDLWRLKVWCWLCLPDLQFRTLYYDFLYAHRFSANFPVLLLVLLWFLYSKTQESQQSKQWNREIHSNLWACKKSQYNVRNCKSGRHNQRHTYRCCKSKYKSTSTSINIPSYGLKVKKIKNRKTKHPSPCRKIGHFMLLNIVKIFLFGNLQELNHLFYLWTNHTHVMIVYSWIENIIVNYIFSIKLMILIPICSTMYFYRRLLYGQLKNKGV